MKPPAAPPQKADPELRKYATDKQWQCILAWIAGGSYRKAEKKLGIDQSLVARQVRAVYVRAAQAGYAPDHDMTHEAPPGQVVKGVSTLYDADGEVREQWNKTRMEGMAPEERVVLPDPKTVTKVSTLYDQQGRVTQQWVAEKPEAIAQLRAWEEAAKAMAETLPKQLVISQPLSYLDPALMACYPVGDHHLGMLSWPEETGGDWDLKIGEKALANATDYLLGATPPCEQSTIVFLGDFMHYDSFESVTPTQRNLLDADGRYPKMVRAAIRAMRYTIEQAARRHGKVHVIVEIGNHDLSSSIFLMECLANIYAENPRITIDTSPRHYHYFDFGNTLVGTHHGHGCKPDRLPSIMAADRAEAWGRTKYRYWWTGHIHHMTVKDYEACSVESFRILAPSDAWAHQKGFRAQRDMKAIVLHKDFGEVGRHIVRPSMFGVKDDLS